MKLSPVQLLDSHPFKVSVDFNSKAFFEEEGEKEDNLEEDLEDDEVEFSIEHMTHVERLSSGSDGEHPSYGLMLGVRSSEDSDSNHYSFEIVMVGHFSIDPTVVANVSVDDLAVQYGFSILYGQIRDLLMGITARMKPGVFILPTMSFMDAKFPQDEANST
jgi:hypothetical protein